MPMLAIAVAALVFVWLAIRETGREVGVWPGGYWSYAGWADGMGTDGAEARDEISRSGVSR